jgi:hypothetical protein
MVPLSRLFLLLFLLLLLLLPILSRGQKQSHWAEATQNLAGRFVAQIIICLYQLII